MAGTAELVVPRRASGVVPVGQLHDGGFVEQQWLLRRDERFVQVSELLYRVVELVDGLRSTDEIASDLTATTKWEVTGEDVARIIERKLAPLGLVDHPDWVQATSSGPAPSPLLVNARLRIIGPGLIERVARAGQHLFSPPALSALLALVLASQLWLFTEGQPGVAMQQLISTPLSLPLLAGLLLLAGAAHEFGHAAALRYGGARARAMGIGWYLVVPIFYTDVTESYRLTRGARVRTDLGGLYFHLLTAAAFIAVYAATDYDAFLVAALLIDLDVARQLIPFIRLDGYWVLADLTGIPDLFTHAAPRLRRLFGKHSDGPAAPALRPRVKRIFAAYLVLTVPIIIGLFGYVIWQAPSVVSRASAALETRANLLADASERRELGDGLLAAAEMLLFALPIIGFTCFAIVIARFASAMVRRRVATSSLPPEDAPPPRAHSASGRFSPRRHRADLTETISLADAIAEHLELKRRHASQHAADSQDAMAWAAGAHVETRLLSVKKPDAPVRFQSAPLQYEPASGEGPRSPTTPWKSTTGIWSRHRPEWQSDLP
jgi:putative peptide zinc metalloprotease protein